MEYMTYELTSFSVAISVTLPPTNKNKAKISATDKFK